MPLCARSIPARAKPMLAFTFFNFQAFRQTDTLRARAVKRRTRWCVAMPDGMSWRVLNSGAISQADVLKPGAKFARRGRKSVSGCPIGRRVKLAIRTVALCLGGVERSKVPAAARLGLPLRDALFSFVACALSSAPQQ